jgi:CRISPR-associated protein (TIGR03986 family)
MSIIKAPFNFVPLSNKVYSPEWANQISQDIPFKDGKSGCIDLKITAKTPIFVRNGHNKDQAEEKDSEYNSFSKIDNRYFIPATSLKGCIRNVLEIMSLCKMQLDKNAMFAQRDWDNDKLYNLKDVKVQKTIRCGWLKEVEDGNYSISDCGKPYRINHEQLDKYFGKNIFAEKFSEKNGIDLKKEQPLNGKDYDPKMASYKYALIDEEKLKDFHFEEEDGSRKVHYDPDSSLVGTIVFTGQPDPWKMPRKPGGGKFYEFVFEDVEKARYRILEKEFNHFKFIYSDSPDWRKSKERLRKRGIPVFFRLDEKNKNKNKVKDFGLAYLYKLPYEKSPYDLLVKDHKDNEKPDLAECIFGYTNNADKKSLRGRVQFSNAFSTNAQESGGKVRLVLSSPKASYYPLYISQDGARGITAEYATYNNGRLAGWKRYPIRENTWLPSSLENPKMDTYIYPLQAGTEFSAKIRFHNLKEIELGALLSALTFHHTPNCYHQIGQGKPYGFGKVSIEAHLSGAQEGEEQQYMAKYEKTLLDSDSNWLVSPQIKQLFTMAHEQITPGEEPLFKYMEMSNKKEGNDFVKAKDKKEYLQKYTELKGKEIKPEPLYNPQESEKETDPVEEEENVAKNTELLKAQQAEENKKKKIADGLVFLQERSLQGNYKVFDFNGAKNRINQWLKIAKQTTLPEDQYPYLKDSLQRFYDGAKSKEKKSWCNFEDKNVWKQISQWVGPEISRQWFNELKIK